MREEILSSDSPFFFSKIDFLISSLVVFYFATNSNGFLTVLKFISCSKTIISRSPIFFGRSRGRFKLIEPATCCTSAVVLTKNTAS